MSDTNSSFYGDTPNYATTYPTQNDSNTNPTNGNDQAPSSFYPNGGIYAFLSSSDSVLAQMQALVSASQASASAAATSATNAASSATSAATSAANAAASVQAAAGTATPIVDGTAAVGSSTKWAHEDHVHPTDTSRAPLASPALTGTPTAPTAAFGTNTTQLATTAFVLGQAGGSAPVMDGTAAAGSSSAYARADHVHPTDTSRAPLASPTFTGTPAAPTATAGDNSTKLATTAFVTTALSPYRTPLTAPRTYYVRTDGSDSNNGLSNSSGGAFLTIQKAIDTVNTLDMGPNQVTVQVADGTYTGAVNLKSYLGLQRPILQGNTTTPANCLLNTSTHCIQADGNPVWLVQGFKLQSSSGSGLRAINQGRIYFSNMDFGATYDIHVWAIGGQIYAVGNYTISAAPTTANICHVGATAGGYVSLSGFTVTITASLNWTVGFALASRAGILEAYSITWAGTGAPGGATPCIGQKITCSLNGVMYVAGAGTSYFPGATYTAPTTGGQYA